MQHTHHPVFVTASVLLVTVFLLCSTAKSASAAQLQSTIPVPTGFTLTKPLSQTSPQEILDQFVGMPYRSDGVTDDMGRYIVYAQPTTILPTPGFNCSGLVIQASRFLLQKNISLQQAFTDRLHDSAKGSDLGHDWDFGWDLIMNLSEGFTRTIFLPNFTTIAPEQATGLSPRGFDLHAAATWPELLKRFRTGHIYLISFSKDTKQKGYSMLHYHVGVVYKANEKEVWMYQTTTTGTKANRRNLATKAGLQEFLHAFANSGGVKKHIIVLEVALPQN